MRPDYSDLKLPNKDTMDALHRFYANEIESSRRKDRVAAGLLYVVSAFLLVIGVMYA